jgi:hypothetical protein
VKAGAREAGLRGCEDFAATVGLELDVGAAHELLLCDK